MQASAVLFGIRFGETHGWRIAAQNGGASAIGSALARGKTMTDDANPTSVGGSAAYGGTALAGRPGRDVHRAHVLQTMIRTRVYEQARNRLVSDEFDTALDDLGNPDAVARFKQALYARPGAVGDAPAKGAAGPVGFGMHTPRQWLAQHPAPLPLKLAFLESVARALGEDWTDDDRNFFDVTMAMGRLQLALRQVMVCEATRWRSPEQGHALITVPPGEEHLFGQCIIEELFRARGWVTDLYCPESQARMIERIDAGGHDIVCLSWSTGALADVAASAIARIEQMPAAHRPAIIAGGVASLNHSGWLVRLGVDCVCDSTYGALAVAQAMLKQRDQTGVAVAPLPRTTSQSALP